MKKRSMIITIAILLLSLFINAQNQNSSDREKLLMDSGWRFALGNACDAHKDFGNATAYFSYFAKAGYGDGAAAQNFDDRGWREIDLPHDWAVELPFDSTASYSHGFKPIGKDFPENSIGWYRKYFTIPESDLGKKISIEFEGVHRNSRVWVNGFFLGNELSGYTTFKYDLTDYLNYGDKNVIAVRVDASIEEGWFYEGAGIYRHVWLHKISPLHFSYNGTFVTTELNDDNTKAYIKIRTEVINESNETQTFGIDEKIVDANNNIIASGSKTNLTLQPLEEKKFVSTYEVSNPKLWSIESPKLHKLLTKIEGKEKLEDEYETTFGIRTVRFDADKGFFLNGKHIKITGTNEHQDQAGVGSAIPDALIEWRVKQLKSMGSNAIRTSHNPPSPQLLNVCDELGMLVLDENRLMGTNKVQLNWLKNLIERDRNHPSVIIWSLGNEEWQIEGNVTGIRIAETMQAFAEKLDSSRAFTVALSGGWDNGIGSAINVIGYNYIFHGDIDGHHKKFPGQPSIGTEETTGSGTRGIYKTDKQKGFLAPKYLDPGDVGAQFGWNFYADREFLSGLFFWTGFDYRGEPNPLGWPQVTSQSGILDVCGFPKDIYYYLQSWWTNEPVLHITPHWNNKNKNEKVDVTVFSNCDEVELFLNDKSLGKKEIETNKDLKWTVNYEPGVLSAKGYRTDKVIISKSVETTGKASVIKLDVDRNIINADGKDVSVITVAIQDQNGLLVPTADNELYFSLEGNGEIIGVGNGNPASHEADKYLETVIRKKITGLKELPVDNLNNRPEVNEDYDDSNWIKAFSNESDNWLEYKDSLIVVRGNFELSEINNETIINLFTRSIVDNQSIYINGHLIAEDIAQGNPDQSYKLEHDILHEGINTYAITGKRLRRPNPWDLPNRYPGIVQIIYPAKQWKRKAFNGFAQIIVQSTKKAGNIKLTTSSTELKDTSIEIQTEGVNLIPAID